MSCTDAKLNGILSADDGDQPSSKQLTGTYKGNPSLGIKPCASLGLVVADAIAGFERCEFIMFPEHPGGKGRSGGQKYY